MKSPRASTAAARSAPNGQRHKIEQTMIRTQTGKRGSEARMSVALSWLLNLAGRAEANMALPPQASIPLPGCKHIGRTVVAKEQAACTSGEAAESRSPRRISGSLHISGPENSSANLSRISTPRARCGMQFVHHERRCIQTRRDTVDALQLCQTHPLKESDMVAHDLGAPRHAANATQKMDQPSENKQRHILDNAGDQSQKGAEQGNLSSELLCADTNATEWKGPSENRNLPS